MKKYLLIFLIVFCGGLIAQEDNKSHVTISGKIMNVSDRGKFISVICVDKEKNKTMANLYNKEGKKLISISDPINNGLLFAEYVQRMGYYLICFEGYESYNGHEGKRGTVQAIEVSTGRIIWECLSDGLYYEISPNEDYLLTNSTQELDELKGELEVIRLSDGKKITLPNRFTNFRAAWLDSEKILIISNTESLFQPHNRINELKKWREDLQKREQLNFDNYRNRKISKNEYEINDKKFSEEFFEKSREFSKKIELESTFEIISKVTILNVIKNKIEIEKNITDKNGNKLVVDVNNNYLIGLTIDKENHSYIYCKEPNKNPEETIYTFLKSDKNLNLIWQSPLLPLTHCYKYTLEGKPYFGFMINNTETFVEPLNGKLLPLVELKKTFPQAPSLNLLREFKQDIFVDRADLEIDLINNNLILK